MNFVQNTKLENRKQPQQPNRIIKYIQLEEDHTQCFKNMTADDVPAPIKRKLALDFQEEQSKVCRTGDFDRLFGTDMSQATYREQRMMECGEYRVNRKKNHTGDLDKYAFDKEMVKDRLRELCDENKDLGSAMHLKWAKLAREAGLRKKVPDTKELNLTQVNHRNVLEFADIMVCVSSVKLNVIWSWEMKTAMFFSAISLHGLMCVHNMSAST